MARPRINLSKEMLFDLYGQHKSWHKVADVLGITHPTVYRRLAEWGIDKPIPVSQKYTCK